MNILREFFFEEKESCYIPLPESKRKKKDYSSPFPYYHVSGDIIFDWKNMSSADTINYMYVGQVI